VNFGDLQALIDHWGVPGDWACGDFDGNGVVSFTDFQALLDNWRPSGAPAAGQVQVPEPASLVLLAAATFTLLTPRTRRPRQKNSN
jgi:hypothetical protein